MKSRIRIGVGGWGRRVGTGGTGRVAQLLATALRVYFFLESLTIPRERTIAANEFKGERARII